MAKITQIGKARKDLVDAEYKHQNEIFTLKQELTAAKLESDRCKEKISILQKELDIAVSDANSRQSECKDLRLELDDAKYEASELRNQYAGFEDKHQMRGRNFAVKVVRAALRGDAKLLKELDITTEGCEELGRVDYRRLTRLCTDIERERKRKKSSIAWLVRSLALTDV